MTRPLATCPVCHGTTARQRPTYAEILNLPRNTASSVFDCADCGLLYLWPYLADDLLAGLYGKSYFKGVTEEAGPLAIPPSSHDYEAEFAPLRHAKFRDTIQMLLRYVPDARNILDIGAATGDFLAIAQESNLHPTGIECSAYASAQARARYGFIFHQTTVGEYHGEDLFDIIHMNHVFEHLSAPNDALARIARMLTPKGVVYVEVPFQFNVLEVLKFRVTGRRKNFDVFSLHHPIFYTPATLTRIFANHGYRCRSLRVFTWARYPAARLSQHIKRFMWFAASLLGQGIMIEAVFDRRT